MFLIFFWTWRVLQVEIVEIGERDLSLLKKEKIEGEQPFVS